MKITLLLATTFLIVSCSTTDDKRIDTNYDELKENREAMHSLSTELEASQKEAPAWVTSYLDTFECGKEGKDFCAVGRAEIQADDSSPYRCFEVSKINAKANLVSTVQTDISRKIIAAHEDFKISKQKIKSITASGFEVRNISNMRITENYYKKVLKHVGESPQAVYQCLSVASISKFNLQNLVTRQSKKVLGEGVSESFESEIQREWGRFFKITGNESNKVKLEDLEIRNSMRDELAQGSLDQIKNNVVNVAKAFKGVRYQFGGNLVDNGKIDCSAFTRKVFQVVGLSLPRTSIQQYQYSRGHNVDSNFEPGDLVFFDGFRGKGVVSHVGIYIGDDKFVNANGNKEKVMIDSLSTPYWKEKFLGAKRLITPENFPNSRRSLASE